MTSLEEKIEVMTHFKNGGTIQRWYTGSMDSKWEDHADPCWDWDAFEYRVKPPEKKTIKLVAFIDDHGLLRWVKEELFGKGACTFTRVPSEDKLIEV